MRASQKAIGCPCRRYATGAAVVNRSLNAQDAMPEGGKLTFQTALRHWMNATAISILRRLLAPMFDVLLHAQASQSVRHRLATGSERRSRPAAPNQPNRARNVPATRNRRAEASRTRRSVSRAQVASSTNSPSRQPPRARQWRRANTRRQALLIWTRAVPFQPHYGCRGAPAFDLTQTAPEFGAVKVSALE